MTTLQKDTILVVDDVPGNLEILTEILAPSYEVMVTKSGRRALEIAHGSPTPDLILLDVVMPELDGFETCALLKADPLTKQIPVIFVSSQTETVDEARGFEVGGVDYLTKPVTPLIVRARVKTHLALSRATRELVRQNQVLQDNIRLLEQIEQIAHHDLKSPLTIFMTASDYLATTGNLTPEQLDFLKDLDESAKKMLTMIDQSLDLFKMERGQYRVNPIHVELVEVVRLVCHELASLASGKKVRCSVLLNGRALADKDSCFVLGEPILFSTMISNLVKNAIEASPATGEVIISLSCQDPFLIEIRNQGVIPPEIQPRFLERFVTAGKAGGTGLGAYSARLMAKTLGGDIRFVSTPESGTVITVSLPHRSQPIPF